MADKRDGSDPIQQVYSMHGGGTARNTAKDTVDSPSHYTAGKYETIDVIEHVVTGYEDPFVSHCVGTATKYLDRAPYKHGEPSEDLRKAAKYLEFAIKRLDGGDIK